jgi:hypothetical protein
LGRSNTNPIIADNITHVGYAPRTTFKANFLT